jgi:two-component system, cell cycle sensor histidine kinase and response regulator CckA
MNNDLTHILIVEDDEQFAELVFRAFKWQNNNFRTSVALNLEQAKSIIKSDPPALILADQFLPDGRGCELIVNGKLSDRIPVMIMTAQGDQNLAAEAIKTGALDYIVKSLTIIDNIPHAVQRSIREWDHFVGRQIAEKQLRKNEKRMQKIQRMEAVGRFAGAIAHEFNNILAAISGNAELVEMGLPADDPNKKALGVIATNVERASELTRQLTAFGGQQIFAVREIDLNNMLDELTGLLHRLVGQNLELVIELDQSIKTVKIDPKQIEQAVINLIINAKDNIGQGTRITISTSVVNEIPESVSEDEDDESGEYVLLTVTDNGSNLDNHVREHAFEPFYNGMGDAKDHGLGLPAVFGIIIQSNGHITIDACVGGGTQFNIYLPVYVRDPNQNTTLEQINTSSVNANILVVEDEEPVREMILMGLQHFGYKITAVENAKAALKYIDESKGKIDLLLTDVIMPGMRGTELVDRLRKTWSGLRVIYMSGFPAKLVIAKGSILPGDKFIRKPFKFADLNKIIKEVLQFESNAD